MVVLLLLLFSFYVEGCEVSVCVNSTLYSDPSNTVPCIREEYDCYHYCLVLVGSRNGFKHDFTIALNSN